MKYDIYSLGKVDLKYVVSDLNGTLAIDNKIIEGVKERFDQLHELGFEIYVITGDIHGTAEKLLADHKCKVHVVDIEEKESTQLEQKKSLVEALGAPNVIAYGNGANDTLMLKTAAVGIHVCEQEGGSVAALKESTVTVNSILDGLDLLLFPKRIAGH